MIAEGLISRLRATPRAGVVSGRRIRGATAARSRRARAGTIAALAVAICGVVPGAGWLWLRESSLVAVQRVRITGLLAPDAGQIRAALVSAARGMTTLDVSDATLRDAVSPYPVVKRLEISTQFPHGLTIRVIEQIPVATVMLAGRPVAVAADGTLLRDVVPSGPLPLLTVKDMPGGPRIADGGTLEQLQLLAAAPYAALARVQGVSENYWHGLVAQLRHGPAVYFGDAGELAAKWQAALTVLAIPADAGAAYIDVTDPARPAAGSGAGQALSSAEADAAAQYPATSAAELAPASGTGTSAPASGTATPATGTAAPAVTGSPASATGTPTLATGTAPPATAATGAPVTGASTPAGSAGTAGGAEPATGPATGPATAPATGTAGGAGGGGSTSGGSALAPSGGTGG